VYGTGWVKRVPKGTAGLNTQVTGWHIEVSIRKGILKGLRSEGSDHRASSTKAAQGNGGGRLGEKKERGLSGLNVAEVGWARNTEVNQQLGQWTREGRGKVRTLRKPMHKKSRIEIEYELRPESGKKKVLLLWKVFSCIRGAKLKGRAAAETSAARAFELERDSWVEKGSWVIRHNGP